MTQSGGVTSLAVSAAQGIEDPEGDEISGTLTCLGDVWTTPFGASWKEECRNWMQIFI